MPTPAQNINNAISAYADAAQRGTGGLEARDAPDEGGFAGLVKDAIREAVTIGEKSEAMSIAGIKDNADLSQVVTAVAEAELTLQTVVSVRDKVIDAYKEIIRMPM